MCKEIDRDFENILTEEEISRLNFYAVELRYPESIDFEPDLEEANEAIEIAEKVKEFVIKKLKERGLEI